MTGLICLYKPESGLFQGVFLFKSYYHAEL